MCSKVTLEYVEVLVVTSSGPRLYTKFENNSYAGNIVGANYVYVMQHLSINRQR